MGLHVRRADAADARDLGDLLTVRRSFEAEANPDDPVIGGDELRGELTHDDETREAAAWIVADSTGVLGSLSVDLLRTESNHHLVDADLAYVLPSRRRRGAFRAVLRAALDELRPDRTSILLWAADEDSAAVYRRLGLTKRTEERCSRLHVADLDGEQQRSWIEDAPAAAAGYRLVSFEGPIPDEHVQSVCDAQTAMQDMPLDDLEYQEPQMTPSLLRSTEQAHQARGLRSFRTLAIAADGSAAGISDLFVSGHRPALAFQGDTGVVRAHRGHALGRWLKAENLAFARTRAPGLAVVETYNAESNPWMLHINVDMGFRPSLVWSGFQGEIDEILATI